ncbi:MAG: hypothetical protein IPK76_22430 [Lewinellaceae bacterium]|nr:hypothetical protein [Lewinellaceae bacterium]
MRFNPSYSGITAATNARFNPAVDQFGFNPFLFWNYSGNGTDAIVTFDFLSSFNPSYSGITAATPIVILDLVMIAGFNPSYSGITAATPCPPTARLCAPKEVSILLILELQRQHNFIPAHPTVEHTVSILLILELQRQQRYCPWLGRR